jgi:uncharacterized integral membrane protein (TIGR00698 family)
VLCAVLIGALWRNTLGVTTRLESGLEWLATIVLRFGIALVGLRLTVTTVGTVGLYALPIVVVCIAAALLCARFIARRFGLSATLGRLIAVGTAVCGCTAVMAVGPIIHARKEEMGYAVGCVVLFGLIAMLSYPWIAHAWLGSVPIASGIFLGTAIHDTSQVMGAGLIYSQQFDSPLALASATTAKLLRNLSMVALIPWFAYEAASTAGPTERGPLADISVFRLVPAFVWCFLGFVVLRTIGDVSLSHGPGTELWSSFVANSAGVSEFCLVAGMAAVGLGIRFESFRGIGWRPLAAALLVALMVGVVSFTMTLSVVRFAMWPVAVG